MRLATITLALLVMSGSPISAADADKGRTISVTHCVRCHVVEPANRLAGISSTPSFMTLVGALPDWRERFETFYARRPHPVHVHIAGLPQPDETIIPPNAATFELNLQDVDDIVAYAEQLHSGGTQ